MGSSDDLEDYDAELELALKREYSDVFGIFRYCVITQEATYLCNSLSVDCVPHPSYLLFEIDMEDVWVWDRNRPTRMIPKAHVYTTTDITVEQLKEGDGADLASSLPQGVLEQLRASMMLEDDVDTDSDDDGDDGDPAVGGLSGPDAAAAAGDDGVTSSADDA